MTEFFRAVARHEFLLNGLLAGVLAGVACGVVGSYVAVRRIGYLAGGIAHCVLGGIGAARYLHVVAGWTWLRPIHGAVFAALLAAAIIGWVSLRAREREDLIIGALWAVGMAVGVLFVWHTPGYQQDLMSYLFGNILMVSGHDLWLVAALDLAVLGAVALWYKQLLAVCYDEEYARLRGVNVEFHFLLLLCLTALTVVLLATVVGVVMVIALLTLPVALAGFFARRLWHLMVGAAVASVAVTTLGLAVSYTPDLPPGATIIVLSGAAYLGALVLRAAWRALRRRRAPAGSSDGGSATTPT